MIINRLLFILLLLSCTRAAISQQRTRQVTKPFELSGYIRDSLTGASIAAAAIRLNFDKIGIATDTSGYFSIMLHPQSTC